MVFFHDGFLSSFEFFLCVRVCVQVPSQSPPRHELSATFSSYKSKFEMFLIEYFNEAILAFTPIGLYSVRVCVCVCARASASCT